MNGRCNRRKFAANFLQVRRCKTGLPSVSIDFFNVFGILGVNQKIPCKGDDVRNIILVLALLGYAQVVQAASGDAATRIRDDELASAVLSFTSAPKLRSAIALIYDEQEQSPLYAKNADTVAPIASITKLMTAMVVLDAQLPLDEEISISREDMDKLKGTSSRMNPGLKLTRGELLRLALMSSENRAAAALARTYPGGTAAAVAMMNIKALELDMRDSRFMDPTGLNSGNVSTAQDLVRMVRAAQRYDLIHQYSTTSSYTVKPIGRGKPMRFGNTNPLVKNASWDIGVSKTGYISEAGRCLVMQVKINQRPVVIVLLDSWGNRTRIGDANRIKKWMESAYLRAYGNPQRG